MKDFDRVGVEWGFGAVGIGISRSVCRGKRYWLGNLCSVAMAVKIGGCM